MEILRVLAMIRFHINRKAHVDCNFKCLIENEGLLNVIGNYIYCKCGNIWKRCKIETL